MKKELRIAYVYLPDGKEQYFSTRNLGDHNYRVCEVIEGEPDRLNVVYKEDDRMIAKAFIGIPYILEIMKD